MAIDKDRIKALHNELDDLLQAFAKKNKLKLAKNRITYLPTSFTVALEFGDTEEIGNVDPARMKDMLRYGSYFGITKDHLNAAFTVRGKNYTVQGMKKSRGTWCVLGKPAIDDGRIYLIQATEVATALKLEISEMAKHL